MDYTNPPSHQNDAFYILLSLLFMQFDPVGGLWDIIMYETDYDGFMRGPAINKSAIYSLSHKNKEMFISV